jgi:hypothetical protein
MIADLVISPKRKTKSFQTFSKKPKRFPQSFFMNTLSLSLSLSRAPNKCNWPVKGIRQILQQVFRVSEWLQANDTHTLSLSQELLTSVVGWLKVLGRFSNKFLGYPNVCKQMTAVSLSQELLPSVVGQFKVLGRFSNKF